MQLRVNGSERIQDPAEKLKRMQELAGIKTTTVKEAANESVLHSVAAPDGNTYGLVAEGAKVFIKKLVSENYQYLTGLENKTEYQYGSYADGLKHLNIMIKDMNNELGLTEGVDVLKKK